MSAPLTETLFRQRLLACGGFYAGKLDGQWGPKTDVASQLWDTAFAVYAHEIGTFDSRTEATLHTILPAAQRLMRELLVKLRAACLDARAISGTRTYAEQSVLYAQGRSTPGRIVTHTRAGLSNHNFGIAIDIGIFDGGRYLPDSPLYDKAGELSEAIEGVEWGGRWRAFQDKPHYQVATGLPLAEVRAAFEAGRPFLQVK